MVQNQCEMSFESVKRARMQVLHARRTQKRRVFMTELSDYRHDEHMKIMESVRRLNGPLWYQPLSDLQRHALDSLPEAISRDILQNRPIRTAKIIKRLGIYPKPNAFDLMTAVFMGRTDPKEVLAHIFLMQFGHPVENKPQSYSMMGRLLMSGIFYLGQSHLIKLLKERFKPPPKEEASYFSGAEVRGIPKGKKGRPESPYLIKPVAKLYKKPKRKPYVVPPLPNLDDLNEPFEEDIVLVAKPPPPTPPPEPKKKYMPTHYCLQQAGIHLKSTSEHSLKTDRLSKQSPRKSRKSLLPSNPTPKKVYGLNLSKLKKKKIHKLVPPKPAEDNIQYMINGVFTLRGRKVFIITNVVILPPDGDIINGGIACVKGEMININQGISGHHPDVDDECSRLCDCMEYEKSVIAYLQRTKCRHGHYYDHLPMPQQLENQTVKKSGKKSQDKKDEFKEFELLPYFEKPTEFSPLKFNYENIYNLDDKSIHVTKEFLKLWKTDDILQTDDCVDNPVIAAPKKKKKNIVSGLGPNPEPADYVRCALRSVKGQNLAARLPDVHLTPELKEWMRFRLYGPYTREEKLKYVGISTIYWQKFKSMAAKGYSHIASQPQPKFRIKNDWSNKITLTENFNKFRYEYMWDLFKSYVKFSNYFWTSMFQDKFPDKKFREVFFSYTFAGIEDMCFVNPYSSVEAMERFTRINTRRYICKPKGAEELRS